MKLTPAQERVLVYLYRAGWASAKQTARMLYRTPRQHARARAILGRLVAAGLAETYLVHAGAGRAWHLTEAGRELARARSEASS